MYKSSQLPQCIGPLNYVADLPGRRPLRSAGINCLTVPPVKLTTVANRAFPNDMTSPESLSTFHQ